MRGIARGAAVGAGIVVVALALAEIVLQGGALLVRDRVANGPAAGAVQRIVCVGDSHTYGALVPVGESYPGHLQRLLDAHAPGAYAVVNLGLPGLNTALVRERLRAALARYRPHVVIVWCGVNNTWNRAGPGDAGYAWRDRLDAWATLHVRLYRLLRTWRHDRALEAELAGRGTERAPRIAEHRNADGTVRGMTVLGGGRSEVIEFRRGGDAGDVEAAAAADYRAMIADAQAAGARIVFIAYPVEAEAFRRANQAMRRAAGEAGVAVVETHAAVFRVPPEQRKLLWAAHPNGAMYGEIARDIAAVLVGAPDADADADVLARLDFDEGRAEGLAVTGACPPVAGACGRGGCYRWEPDGDTCRVEVPLARDTAAARVSARLRIDRFPAGAAPYGGHNVLGLLEPTYGSGVYLQLVPPDRLRLFTFGGGSGSCGPLARPLERDVWYDVRIRAEKSARAALELELRGADGGRLEAVRCEGQPAGGGRFAVVRAGSADPGAVGSVEIDDVEVSIDRGGGVPAPGGQ
jgi:lysophospholipase L1-like esterase